MFHKITIFHPPLHYKICPLSVAGEFDGELVAPVLGLKQLDTDGIEFSLILVFGCEFTL